MKTPTVKIVEKEKKSPQAVFKKTKEGSNIKPKKSEETCLTPKGKTTLSNLKPKSEISIKKEKATEKK